MKMENAKEGIAYKSPITLTYEELTSELQRQNEDAVMKAVLSCNIQVDKKELLKALRYDRRSYDTGFESGFTEGCSAVEDLLFYADDKFLNEAYKEECEKGYKLLDLIAMYGAKEIFVKWNEYKEQNQGS